MALPLFKFVFVLSLLTLGSAQKTDPGAAAGTAGANPAATAAGGATVGGGATSTTANPAAAGGGTKGTTANPTAATAGGAAADGGGALTINDNPHALAAARAGANSTTANPTATTAGGAVAAGGGASGTTANPTAAATGGAVAAGAKGTTANPNAAATGGAVAAGAKGTTANPNAAAGGGATAAKGGAAGTTANPTAVAAGGAAGGTTANPAAAPAGTTANQAATTAGGAATAGGGAAGAAAAADPAAAATGGAAAVAGGGAGGPGYDPGFTGLWEMQQENAGVSAMHLQIMPNTNMALMYDTGVLGPSIINLTPAQGCRKILEPPGSPDDCTAHCVEYNTDTGAVRPLKIGTDFWCSSGGLTVEGSLISIGGTVDGGRAVRYLDPCPDCEFRDTPNVVAEPRWYATQVQLPDNRYFVIGGRAAFSYEYVGPEGQINDKAFFSQFIKDTTDRDENNLYPHVHLSTDGNLFIFANDRSIIFNPNTNTIVRELPVLDGGARCYPASGSSALLPISLNAGAPAGGTVPAQVMICGGGKKEAYAEASKGNFIPALDDCNTIELTNPAAAWVRETMPSPRIMGDVLILPNAELLLINGAKRGASAWELAEDPNFVPTMYSSERPDGQRFMECAPALVARMYHASSALLIDGKILVAGSNTHDRYKFDVKYPTEVRVEKFSPPYLNPALGDSKPEIQAQGTDIKLAYGQPFKVTCTAGAPLVRDNIKVTLYSPVFSTHGCNMNQRLLILPITDFVADPAGGTVMTVTAPTTPVLAPAGYYMLFVNNGVVPSTGVWVQIK